MVLNALRHQGWDRRFGGANDFDEVLCSTPCGIKAGIGLAGEVDYWRSEAVLNALRHQGWDRQGRPDYRNMQE